VKRYLLAFFFAAGLWGQQTITFTVRKQTVLAAGAEVVTVQQPSTGAKLVRFIGAYFDCSVACSFTLERNGSAATSTALAVNNLNPGEQPPTTTAWSASNVGTGSVIWSYNCAAACSVPIDLTGLQFGSGGGTGTNLTLRSNSITGTVDIAFKFTETY